MKNEKIRGVLRFAFISVVALGIPGLLVLNAFQASKYRKLQKAVEALEEKQVRLIEENKKLITDISILSNSDRIENAAENDLGMRKAETEEIVRVEMKGRK